MRRFLGLVLCVVSMAVTGARAELRLPAVFTDHAVLQRDQPVPVWGWAEAGASVTVTFAGQTKSATAGTNGAWRVTLDALKTSDQPQELKVVSGADTRVVTDVLVGEVWLASGQSNMEWPLINTDGGEADVAASAVPGLRLLQVPKVMSGRNEPDVKAAWAVAGPDTARGFSAVAYHFGTNVLGALKCPVGLIASAWGGTYAEPWIPLQGFAAVPEMKALGAQLAAGLPGEPAYVAAWTSYLAKLDAWRTGAGRQVESGAAVRLPPAAPAVTPVRNAPDAVGLYQAMIHPLVPYAMRGALWYQGESNLGQGIEYVHRMRALIAGWRTVWGQGDFPFYFVQLAPYVYSPDRAQKLPEVWVAQTRVTSLVTNTGMAVINDIGNPKDIHPRNKRDVGRRLSLLALNRTYGRGTGEDSGPLYAGYEREGGAITVRFAHTGGGLVARDGQALTLFEIAGEDDVFVPATAEIAKDGKSVRVSSAQVAQPRAVRFAWDNVASPNLMNREGLPASAFHTHWPEDRELGVNLVRGRDYKSSDPNVAGWDKPGLTDGVWGEDAKTCYASGNKDAFPKTVELDLGAGATVRAVRLGVPKFGSTRTVEVSTSEDGTTFVPLGRKEFAQGTAQRVLLTGAPRTARWVRVTFPDHHDARVGYDPTFVFVSELEVFGDAGK